MKKFKLKIFIIIFSFLLVIQFLIGLADVLLSQGNSDLTSMTSVLITFFSFPISLINPNLPFYVSESLLMLGLFWGINLIIQSVFVYLLLIVFNKMKDSK